MKTYRLYCGRNIPTTNKEISDREIQDFLKSTVSTYFSGFTIYSAVGYWNQESEKTIIIEIITDDLEKVKIVANTYKAKFNQESVLITATDQDINFL